MNGKVDLHFNCPVEHLLLVAGASGSGKSTFLEDLAGDRLPARIVECLPPGCASWIQSTGWKTVRNRAGAKSQSGKIVGLALHYDILRPFETGLCTEYGGDNALSVLGRSAKITLVNLRPRPEILVQQLSNRIRLKVFPKILRPLISRVIEPRRLREPIVGLGSLGSAQILLSRKLRSRLQFKERHRKLVRLYGEEAWLDTWYERWDKFIVGAAGNRLKLPIVYVEPLGGARFAARFRLLRAES